MAVRSKPLTERQAAYVKAVASGVARRRREPKGPRPLTPRQQQYVNGVLRGLSKAEAARQANYAPVYSRQAGGRIEKVPGVTAAIQHAQAELRGKTLYDVAQAVKEIDQAIIFGYARQNPMAVAKLLELKSRLHGLLVDKHEVVTVDISGALLAARQRAAQREPREPTMPTLSHGAAPAPDGHEPDPFRNQVAFPDND